MSAPGTARDLRGADPISDHPRRRRYAAVLAVVAAVFAGLPAAGGLAVAATTASRAAAGAALVAGAYQPLVPARILDTGAGVGAPQHPVATQATLTLQASGRGGIPASGVAAVVVNLTVASPTAGGYLTAYPVGVTRPTVSNVNFVAGQSTPNLVTVRVGTGGRIALYNGSAGSVRLIADVQGYYTAGPGTVSGAFTALTPARVLDTGSGIGAPARAVAAGATLTFTVTGHGGVPSTGAGAVMLNLTAASPRTGGFLTAYPYGGSRPTTSSVNFTGGQSRANAVAVRLGSGGRVSIYNGSAGTVRLVADVSGYYRSGLATTPDTYVSLAPQRILDTGAGLGAPKSAVGPGAELTFQVSGKGGVPTTGASAVVLNLTVASATRGGFVTEFVTAGRPATSNLNFLAGHNVANLVVARVRGDGTVHLYNGSSGTVRLVADVSGYSTGRPSPLTWSGPMSLGSPGYVKGVSCAASSFCAEVSDDGRVATYNGSTWSAPATINGTNRLVSVSCPTTTFCVAIGDKAAMLYNGTSWTAPQVIDSGGGLVAVSCGSATSCIAVDNQDQGGFVTTGHAFAYDGTGWTAGSVTAKGFTALSCPSPSFCGASDDDGAFYVYDGASWSVQADSVLSVNGAGTLSCVSSAFCAAAPAGDNTVQTYDGSSWTDTTQIPTNVGVAQVSCTTATRCVAATGDIAVSTWNGVSWSALAPVMAPGTSAQPSLSCVGASFCALVSLDGYGSTFTGTSWTAAAPVAPAQGSPRALSCAAATFCVTVSDTGMARVFNGATWGGPVEVHARTDLINVSCPTTSFCLAIDLEGDSWVFDGATASNPAHNALSFPIPLSCASPTFCVAAGDSQTATFDGTSWSTPIAAGGNVLSVSCPAAGSCWAGSTVGLVKLTGATWGAPVATGLASNPTVVVSCPSTTACVGAGLVFQGADGQFGSALSQSTSFNGASWSPPTVVDPGGFVGDLSCASATFCAQTQMDGTVGTFDGSTWSDPVVLDHTPYGGQLPIECPTANFCLAWSQYNATLYLGTA